LNPEWFSCYFKAGEAFNEHIHTLLPDWLIAYDPALGKTLAGLMLGMASSNQTVEFVDRLTFHLKGC
jgi:hypothetical protein